MSSKPVYNPDALWQIWNYDDIYFGPNSSGQYVPKVKDEVHQIVGNSISRFVCTAVDGSSLIPTLTPVQEQVFGQDVLPTDMLLGNTPDTYRLLIDKSVSPYRLNVDSRLRVYQKSASFAKVFKGTDISSTGVVISQWYNNSGTYTSENLPMELVSTTTLNNNVGILSVMPGWTAAELDDQDVCTVVIYGADGTPLSIRTLYVFNTGFVRGVDAFSKAIVSIALETPFISAANSTIINYPVNVPLNALNLVGVVNYSDGTQARYAVDGTRFSVSGMDSYAPTVVGQTCPIVLKYRLQTGETAYGSQNGAMNHFAENYTLVTTAVDGSYNVQLYVYPIWNTAQATYTLAWFLYDLNRSIHYDVTGVVNVDTTVATFGPSNYGSKQTLRAYLNLKSVNAAYQNFVHVQNVDIVLNAPMTNRPAKNGIPNWFVTQQAGSVPMFGSGAYITSFQQAVNNYRLSLMGDYVTQDSWLTGYYYNSKPLYDPSTETTPLKPTHFNLILGGITTTYAIAQWNSSIVLTQQINNNDNAYIEFIVRTVSNDLLLSRVAVPVWSVNAQGSYI